MHTGDRDPRGIPSCDRSPSPRSAGRSRPSAHASRPTSRRTRPCACPPALVPGSWRASFRSPLLRDGHHILVGLAHQAWSGAPPLPGGAGTLSRGPRLCVSHDASLQHLYRDGRHLMDSRTVRAKHREFLFPCVATYYEEPVVIAEGHGARVTDVEGREYLDFFGGILTLGVGHSHPDVVRRLQAQLERLTHTSTVYPTAEIVRAAERLARLTPGKLKKSFFTTSGTEADETAILLAKLYTGQQEIIALRHSYAGRSLTALSITGQQPWRVVSTQVAGVKHGLSPYCYRCPLGLEYPSCGVKCAQDLEELIRTETTGRPAAFIAEPIQGAGGFIVPPKEYFQIAVGIVRSHGGLFICDEVQTGWGRTGDAWCGIEHWGGEPEIMTFAQSIANS